MANEVYANSMEVSCKSADGKSVACSTPTALEWDAKFKEMADPSGRAVMDVHQQGY